MRRLDAGGWDSDAGAMLGHFIDSPALRAAAAPGAALLAAFLTRAGGRGARWLPPCAAGLGMFAGWLVLAGGASALLHPAGLLGRLPGLGVLAAVAGLATGPGWLPRAAPVALGAVAGWWLSAAASVSDAALAPILAGAALAFLLGWGLRGPRPGAMAAVVLAGGLLAAGAPSAWPLAGAVVLAAALATLGDAAPAPMAVALAGLSVAADLAHGRMRAGFNAVDAACLAPLLALWLLPRVEARLKRAGPWGAVAATAALAIGAVWLVTRIRHG